MLTADDTPNAELLYPPPNKILLPVAVADSSGDTSLNNKVVSLSAHQRPDESTRHTDV